ncbi:MAG: cupin domain-containing protein [Syntrophorhabdus sp.]
MIVCGGGRMTVGDEVEEVGPGDSVWIPAGQPHALENTKDEETFIVVIAAYPRK